jgi:hypothetical protein
MTLLRLHLLLGSLLMTTLAHAERAVDSAPEFALTIYSSAGPGGVPPEQLNDKYEIPGYALISDTRRMNLTQGRSELRFSDVAQGIDPTTVAFQSLTDPEGTRVLEQNYQFDLLSQQKLLERHIGAVVRVTQQAGDELRVHEGTLLSARDGLLLQTEAGVLALNGYSSVSFASVPGGLITKPTLVWLLDAKRGGEHQTRVAYQTKGITWWADYNVVLSGTQANSQMQLAAWVSVVNQSGGSYPQAKIKLVAGEVNRAPVPQVQTMVKMARVDESTLDAGFSESSLFEYHLYTLGRRSDVPNNSTKQLELFPAKSQIPARRELIMTLEGINSQMYYGGVNLDKNLATLSKAKASAFLQFDNTAAQGLGLPLPKGRVRVSQAGPDGALEFIGEDVIEHTPKNETIRIRLGEAFDVVGERKQIDFTLDQNAKVMTETFEYRVRNRKSEAVELSVREYMYRWSGWELQQSDAKHIKQDAQTIDFPLRVAADSERVFRYTVRYRW